MKSPRDFVNPDMRGWLDMTMAVVYVSGILGIDLKPKPTNLSTMAALPLLQEFVAHRNK
jgi:hypothetical protein